jgi:hypothetical protein
VCGIITAMPEHPSPDETESTSFFSMAQILNATSLIETLWACEKWIEEIPGSDNPGPKVAIKNLLNAWKNNRFVPAMADVDTFRVGYDWDPLNGELGEIYQKIVMIGEENGWTHD